MKFEDSMIYRQGMFYKSLGELMTDKDTTVKELTDLCVDNSYDIGIVFSPLVPKEETDE